MAITKTKKLDKVEFVGEFKHLQVKSITEVKEDGTVIASSIERSRYPITSDLTTLPSELHPYIEGVWTSELIDKYNIHLAEENMTHNEIT